MLFRKVVVKLIVKEKTHIKAVAAANKCVSNWNMLKHI